MSSPAASDIRREFERVPVAVVQKAAAFAASTLSDVAGRRGTLDGRIAPLLPTMRLAGPAVTVEVRPGDNLLIHAAMAIAKPGDILVVDGKGDLGCALVGSIMITACIQLGLGGVVIDGAVRDTDELRTLAFPVFAAGANPRGPVKCGPGRINWPISCAGGAIRPGDLIVGDADGVVVIERELAEGLLDLAALKVAEERARLADIVAGRNVIPSWIEGSLRAAGILGPGETL